MKNNCRTVALSVCCLLLFGACSNAKDNLGLTKSAPDEFKVLKRAPLAMPPSYSLRPPTPGAPRPQEQSATDAAAQTVFGAAPAAPSAPSDGGSMLLRQAGAQAADPSIRHTIDTEMQELNETQKTVSQKLLKLGGAGSDKPATIIDAQKEAERLKGNAAEGKPVNAGETPVIKE